MEKVLILKEGRLLYHGEADRLGRYFDNHGFKCPEDFATADWVMEVALLHSLTELKERGFFLDPSGSSEVSQRQQLISNRRSLMTSTTFESRRLLRNGENGASFMMELNELLKRQFMAFRRNPRRPLLRYSGMLTLALLLSVSFQGILGDEPQTFKLSSQVGLIFTLVFAAFAVTILRVGEEVTARHLFIREYVTGHYRLSSYIAFAMISEIRDTAIMTILYVLPTFTIMGSTGRFGIWVALFFIFGLLASAIASFLVAISSEHFDAHSLITFAVTPQNFFCGFITTYDNFPNYVRWLVWLQPATYAFRLLLYEELSSCGRRFSVEEQHILDFVEVFTNGISEVTENPLYLDFEPLLEKGSELKVPQAGQFVGKEGILEYIGYVTPVENPLSAIWDYRRVSLQERWHEHAPF